MRGTVPDAIIGSDEMVMDQWAQVAGSWELLLLRPGNGKSLTWKVVQELHLEAVIVIHCFLGLDIILEFCCCWETPDLGTG